MKIKTTWLGLELKNPVILASITPISHRRINEHVNYYVKAAQKGVGAIIIESFMPTEFGESRFSFTQNDLMPLEVGLNYREPTYMGFSLLGPPYPNISSIKYGIELIKKTREKLPDIPLIGSLIINVGSKEELISTAKLFASIGIDALELNFSCPNIVALGDGVKKDGTDFTNSQFFDIIHHIKKETGLKISLKITPQFNFNTIINSKILNDIDGITYSNAYLGLVPPSILPPFGGKFGRGHMWAYTGIYGPLERFFTYAGIARFKKTPEFNKIQLSAVGGFVEEKNIVEAILLGADTVHHNEWVCVC